MIDSMGAREPQARELHPRDLEAQEALELPDREALSLIDPGAVGGAGVVSASADQYSADSTQFANQQTADASQQSDGYVTDTTEDAQTEGTGTYQPHVTSRAES